MNGDDDDDGNGKSDYYLMSMRFDKKDLSVAMGR